MSCECGSCEWKKAYQFEREEHKQTLLMLEKTLEESNDIFVTTRDMIGFMQSLNSKQPTKSTGTFYKPEYIGRKRDGNRRKE